jgi:hypothetical protein
MSRATDSRSLALGDAVLELLAAERRRPDHVDQAELNIDDEGFRRRVKLFTDASGLEQDQALREVVAHYQELVDARRAAMAEADVQCALSQTWPLYAKRHPDRAKLHEQRLSDAVRAYEAVLNRLGRTGLLTAQSLTTLHEAECEYPH